MLGPSLNQWYCIDVRNNWGPQRVLRAASSIAWFFLRKWCGGSDEFEMESSKASESAASRRSY